MFDDKTAREYLKALYVQFITSKRQSEENAIIAAEQKSSTDDAVSAFIQARDIITAAGAADNHFIGRNMIQFIKAMQSTHDVPLVLEKIRLIILGNYRGVSIRKDKNAGKWTPSRRNMFRLVRRRINDATPEQWSNDVFCFAESKAHLFSHWAYLEKEFPQTHQGAIYRGY